MVSFTSNLGTVLDSIPVTQDINGDFTTSLPYTELCTYTILVRYVVNTSQGYRVISYDSISAYNITALVDDGLGGQENPYTRTTDPLAKSYNLLHMFGIKSYFIKSGQKLDFSTDTTTSDFTPVLNTTLSASSETIESVYTNSSDNFLNYISYSNYPVTNLPPVSFNIYGTYDYEGLISNSKVYRYTSQFTGTPTSYYATKNTEISSAGYYEVVFAYKYDNYSNINDGSANNETVHYQVFVFQIDNSTPQVSLKTTDYTNTSSLLLADITDTNTTLSSASYTNKNVYAVWETPDYFKANRSAQLIARNYDLSGSTTTTYTTSNLTTLGSYSIVPITQTNGNYLLKVFYAESSNLYIEYGFVIDKNQISNINITPIDENTTQEGYYNLITDTSIVDFNSSILINQPFTLTYSRKASGASITTTYKKIPFTTLLSGAGESINGTTYSDYIKSTLQIDYESISSALEYVFDYNTLQTGIVSYANAFVDNSSFIYLFTITDQAGNTSTQFVVYDLTTPEVIITPEIDNIYNAVSTDTVVKWGSYKSVLVKNSSGEITDPKYAQFKTLLQTYTTLFQKLDNNYYLLVPITQVRFIKVGTTSSITFTKGTGSWATSTTLYVVEPSQATATQTFFSGQNDYTYYVSDQANITSNTGIARDNKNRNNISMNLDKSLAQLYANNTNSNDDYGQNIFFKLATNAKQLRISYNPGEEGTGYQVGSFTYTFYDYAPSNYTNIGNAVVSTHVLESGEPQPYYPFNTTPTLVDQNVDLSSLSISGDAERVVSVILNPTTESTPQGTITVSKSGMYVFRREYITEASADYTQDPIVNFYYVFVDRDSIVNIDSESVDVDLINSLAVGEATSDSILYDTGSGIEFRFNQKTGDTRYSAKQIQQYLEYTSILNLFESNRLPIYLLVPNEKYNSAFTLNKASDTDVYKTAYINSLTSINSAFGIKYLIKHENGTIVANTTGDNPYYNTNYVTLTSSSVNQNKQLAFKLAGTYTITLYTNQSAEVNQNLETQVHTATTMDFEFTIVHEAPTGNYYSEYDDQSKMLLPVKDANTTNLNQLNYTSTNKQVLTFEFEDNPNEYKARIDATNLTIKRQTTVSNQTTIYSIVNGVVTSTSGVTGVLSTVTDQDTGLNSYTLNLTDFINLPTYSNQALYTVTLKFVGTEADYTIETSSGTQNYYYREFKIVVDRLKPATNYANLMALDSAKYNASANTDDTFDIQNYFFAINQDFTFVKSSANSLYSADTESYELFVRPLSVNAQTGYPDYFYTITPDEDSFENSSILSSHPRFYESDSNYSIKYTYDAVTTGSTTNYQKLAGDMFNSLVSTYNTNYFEVIERDEAGNYNVYAVQYVPTSISPTVVLKYKQTGQTEYVTDPVVFNSDTTTNEINGNELLLESITSDDYFLKAIINYGSTTLTYYNNPNTTSVANEFTEFITQITNAIAFTTTEIASGYNITITFVNRFDSNYVLNYYVPGTRQNPTFTNLNSTSFKITIPTDTVSTRIIEFKAYKLQNNEWQPLTNDSTGKIIRMGLEEGSEQQSLGGQFYTFYTGEYRFILIDNFLRGQDTDVYKPYYYGLGVNDVREISYSTTNAYKVVNNITYTAETVILNYQANLYERKIYKYVTANGITTLQEITSTSFSAENITSIAEQNGVTKLNFALPGNNVEKHYKIVLILNKNDDQEFIYDFIIYKKLPTIQLKTLSGSSLSAESSPFTENILITWSNTELDFTPTVTLYRTYTDLNGLTKTETTYNVTTGTEITKAGNYTAIIKNSLGYTNTTSSLYNVQFSLVEGDVVVYNVYTKANGVTTEVTASPVTSTIDVLGVNKVLYMYYVLDKFDGSILNQDIEIRTNTSKALTAELVDSAESYKRYRIYGSGDFGYERYIQIVFIPEVSSNVNFSNLQIFQPQYNEENQEIAPTQLTYPYATIIKSIDNYITLKWDSYNADAGNILYGDYYFNNVFVKTIYNYNDLQNELVLSAAGIHKISFRDHAGNIQTFNGVSQLTINLINNLTFTVNGNEPIDNIIVNDLLTLTITNRTLYDADPTIVAKLNGNEIEVNRIGTSGYVYQFTTQGYYEITMQTDVSINGENQTIVTTYNFILLNQNQKLIAFNLPQNYNFEVVSIVRDGVSVLNLLGTDTSQLWLVPADENFGVGQYQITLRAYIAALDTYQNFSFSVYIFDEMPQIEASIPFGTSTTDDLTISYNKYRIYESLGESILRIRYDTGYIDIAIDGSAENTISTTTLTGNFTYYIEILTKDGKLVTSYKITKAEPLNTTAIVLISIAGALIVTLSIIFIILRRRVRFR